MKNSEFREPSAISAPYEDHTVGELAEGRWSHLPRIASQGGRAVVEKYGAEHMARLGKLGARTVAEKYGPGFYAEMGRRNKGVKKRPRRPIT